MNTTGAARLDVDIVDASSLVNQALKGIAAVLGLTERGPVNTPVMVSSWIEFTKIFGGLVSYSNFPLYCKRALESGARLVVIRLEHYTTITDNTTGTSVKAAATALGITATAGYIGTAMNGATLKVVAPISGLATTFDLFADVPGYPGLQYVYRDFPKVWVQSDADKFNAGSDHIKVNGSGTITGVGTLTLAGGTYDQANVVNADYIGDAASSTGLHALDEDANFVRVNIPDKADPALDTAVNDYAESRKDVRSVHRTPIGLNATGIQNYRRRLSPYNVGVAINNWRGSMYTGGLKIKHPTTYLDMNISEIGDVLGALSRRDNKFFEWFAAAGSQRGRISNNLGVVYNLGTAARRGEADAVDYAGVNAVIEHKSFGTVIWGNSSLQSTDTMLKHDNIAELLCFLIRAVKPLVEGYFFDPNDLITWKRIYRKVKILMDYIGNNRGLWGKEGVGWVYQGDQDIEVITQATINNLNDVDAGMYRFNLLIKPIPGLKYVGISVVVSNSAPSFEILSDIDL